MGKVTTILPDTCMFIDVFRIKIDLERNLGELLGGFRISVARCVLDELVRLAATDPQARVALAYARRFPLLETTGSGDDALIEAAARETAIIATADRELRARARARKMTVIFPRSGGRRAVEPSSAGI
jgi:rRNA-processing protein FCF1